MVNNNSSMYWPLFFMKKLLLLVVIFFLGCATFPEHSLDKEHFKESIVVNEETSKSIVIFSTVQGASQHKQNSGVWSDNFIRGFLDKRTGSKTYQIYHVITYSGPGNGQGWKIFSYADYQTPQGTKLTPITLLKKEENCSAIEIYGKCIYTEHLTFKIDEQQLYRITKAQTKKWEYHLIANSGTVLTDSLLKVEIIALLEKMNEYVIAPSALQKENDQKELPDLLNLPEPFIKALPERVIINTIR